MNYSGYKTTIMGDSSDYGSSDYDSSDYGSSDYDSDYDEYRSDEGPREEVKLCADCDGMGWSCCNVEYHLWLRADGHPNWSLSYVWDIIWRPASFAECNSSGQLLQIFRSNPGADPLDYLPGDFEIDDISDGSGIGDIGDGSDIGDSPPPVQSTAAYWDAFYAGEDAQCTRCA